MHSDPRVRQLSLRIASGASFPDPRGACPQIPDDAESDSPS